MDLKYLSQSQKEIKEFVSFVCSSPDALFGEILNKEGFSGPDLRLDPAGMHPLVSLSTASCLQGGFSWCCRRRQHSFVMVQGLQRIFHLEHKMKRDLG